MPVRTTRRVEFVEFELIGAADPDEIIDHIRDHFASFRHRLVLWNAVNGVLSMLPATRFGDIAGMAKVVAERRPIGARTAILVDGRADCLLMSAFVARAEQVGGPAMSVFEERTAAIEWLKADALSTARYGVPRSIGIK